MRKRIGDDSRCDDLILDIALLEDVTHFPIVAFIITLALLRESNIVGATKPLEIAKLS